jgi:5-methylcytosine-specific restriction endonuclease McrA
MNSGYGQPTALEAGSRIQESLLKQIARTVEVMPLWKLQVMGRDVVPFLYENTGHGHRIILKPGVAYCFRRFHGLVLNILQGAWARFIRNLRGNHPVLGEGQDLAEFLFGSVRTSLDHYRPILKEIQSGLCFYCQKALPGNVEVDHFIPWSRYPLDLGHNFVLAHKKCNSDKRDFLAAEPHLDRWLRRNDDQGKVLTAYYQEKSLSHNLEGSLQITRWAYEQASCAGANVWLRGDEVHPLGNAWKKLSGF